MSAVLTFLDLNIFSLLKKFSSPHHYVRWLSPKCHVVGVPSDLPSPTVSFLQAVSVCWSGLVQQKLGTDTDFLKGGIRVCAIGCGFDLFHQCVRVCLEAWSGRATTLPERCDVISSLQLRKMECGSKRAEGSVAISAERLHPILFLTDLPPFDSSKQGSAKATGS